MSKLWSCKSHKSNGNSVVLFCQAILVVSRLNSSLFHSAKHLPRGASLGCMQCSETICLKFKLSDSIYIYISRWLPLSLSISLFICLSNLVLSNLIYSALLQTNLIHILLYISTYNPSIHPSIHPSVRPSIHNFMIT